MMKVHCSSLLLKVTRGLVFVFQDEVSCDLSCVFTDRLHG